MNDQVSPSPSGPIEELFREALRLDGLNEHGEKTGAPISASAAFKLYEMTAKEGHVHAQFQLARCYFNGKGVEQNVHLAEIWFRMVAEKGDSPAAYNNLGCCLEMLGDFRGATNAYLRAAAGNVPDGFYNLGLCYRDGVGVRRDLDTARQHLVKAESLGDPHAAEALKHLPKSRKSGAEVTERSAETSRLAR